MKRRIISLLTALLVATTIFAVPMASAATTETNVTEGTTVTQPTDSTESDDSTGVVDPIGPTTPTTPETPTEPETPSGPAEPTDPIEPSEPEAPAKPVNISKASVTTKYSNYAFTKTAIKPAVTVKVAGKTLKKGTDYTVSYSNNIYPGTAKITIKGIGNYTGTAVKTFAIARPTGLKWKTATTSSIKLDWSNSKNVTGYVVYRYYASSKTWKAIATVKKSEATISKLSGGLGYQFKVRAYYKVGKKTYYSPMTAALKAPSKPNKVSITKIINHPTLYAKVSWGKKNSTGYQVMISRNANFKKYSVYKVASAKNLTKKISGLADGKKYYVKVRAYKTFGTYTAYGSWSKVKSFKTDGTRWYTVSGKKYYYSGGKKASGTFRLDGNKYYFKNGEKYGVDATMWNKVKNSSSKTKYLIAVSKSANRVCVYTGKKGNWKLKYYWKCSTGAPKNGSVSRTPSGSWLMPKTETHLGYIGGHDEYTCWYATRFYNRCFFHSVLYEPASKVQIQDGRLGMNISDGCIRMNIDNAKWIYDNCHAGTRVIVY